MFLMRNPATLDGQTYPTKSLTALSAISLFSDLFQNQVEFPR